jgi:hypothetical protein
MYPIRDEQLVRTIQRDRLAQAANARLVREARGTRGPGQLLEVAAFGELLLEQIRRLWPKRAVRTRAGS